MKQYETGMLVRSIAGHDHGTCYVIMDMCGEYLSLVDGRLKTLSNPKKKRAKHVQPINVVIDEIAKKKADQTLIDEDVKYAIKQYEQKQ